MLELNPTMDIKHKVVNTKFYITVHGGRVKKRVVSVLPFSSFSVAFMLTNQVALPAHSAGAHHRVTPLVLCPSPYR